jgi:eukaryotic-like serine/threonine-protein kinase
MGEVYRARDTRLDRTVAIKFLPSAFSHDPDRLHRFEQEARATAALNHPNILAIYDIGTHEGSPYIVSELLEGQTLGARLRSGPIPARKAIEHGLQIARGLAAAHNKGILHRDLKPDNIFLTEDGRIKILDFGLAKLTRPDESSSEVDGQTLGSNTTPGVLLGTVGYMSPEQVRGAKADQRSDLFSFGAILYEMLSGNRAFRGETPADTVSAILKEEPAELAETNRNISPALEQIVRHCLEKNPQERFQSTQDVAFNLEQLSRSSGSSTSLSTIPAAQRWRSLRPGLAILALLAVAIGSFIVGRRNSTAPPKFQQLTFQRGRVLQARFSPDGQTIIYTAAWNGQPSDVYSTRAERPGARSLDVKGGQVLAVSSTGDLAVLVKTHAAGTFVDTGTLAIVPLSGGSPHEVLENIQYADFSPDGKQLAIIRDLGPRSRVEYPAGKPIYEFTGWLSHLRISPRGDRLAFAEHPLINDDFGSLVVMDLAGNRKILKKDWYELLNLAWSPSGDEVWFTASETGSQRSLFAVTLDGTERPLLAVPGNLVLQDVSHEGRVLLTRENQRRELAGVLAGEPKERDFSWFDWTLPDDISPDGTTFFFHEAGVGGGKSFTAFMRKTDGSPPIQLGEANGGLLSPDGKWVMVNTHQSPSQILLFPIGTGEPLQVTHDSIDHADYAWLPDGRHIIFQGAEPGHNMRLYVQDLDGGAPKAISSEGYTTTGAPVSPDGKYFVAACLDLKPCLLPLTGGEPRAIPGVEITDGPIQWSEDGHSLYMFHFGALPSTVERVDVATGRRTPWKALAPADLAGVHGITVVRMTRDTRVCLYSYLRTFSDLYVVQGLK